MPTISSTDRLALVLVVFMPRRPEEGAGRCQVGLGATRAHPVNTLRIPCTLQVCVLIADTTTTTTART